MFRRISLLIVIAIVNRPIIAEDFDQIPDPRPTGWVVDTTGQLRSDAIERLNELGGRVHRDTGAELAVVVIRSTRGRPHRQFATDLFNRWGLGDRTRNDGLLVFAALQDRRAEIILGDGIDEPAHINASQRIMDSVIIPAFRNNDPSGAMLSGALACARQILAADIDLPNPSAEVETAEDWNGAFEERDPVRFDPEDVRGRAFENPSMLKWLLLGGGLTGGGGALFGIRRYLRYRPRTCRNCRIPMSLLSEAEDDEHLSRSQRLEEHLRSVDYDVWSCPTCVNVSTFRYGAIFTSYSRCPECNARTKHRTTRTIRSATEYSSGLEEITEDCKHCNYHHVYQRSTPRIQRSSSSSSSSGGGFSSGGHSSGSGASGGW